MSELPLVCVEHVSKKFCRSLKRSLWYGLRDLGGEMLGRAGTDRLLLRKHEFLAVDDVSFELRRGECLGLIGANGAGKSTLLKMLNGLVRPDAGRIEIRGRVGALIELGAGFNPILTGRENVYVNGAVLGLSRREIDAKYGEIVAFAGLGEFIDTPVQSYSSGMRVRLGFAVAAHLEPDVLLIDEVLAVGDVGFRAKCMARMTELADRTSIVFVSHNMALVSRISSRILVLASGHASLVGSNVAEGIDRYFAGLPPPSKQATDFGLLELYRFDWRTSRLPENAGPSRAIRSGGDLELQIGIRVRAGAPSFFIELTVTNVEGSAIAQVDSRWAGFSLSESPAEQLVTVSMPKVQLNSGRYFLSAHFTELLPSGAPGRLLHSERNIESFAVEHSTHGYAPLNLEAEWHRQ